MPFAASYHRNTADEPWALRHLFELSPEGLPIGIFSISGPYPPFIVKTTWATAVKYSVSQPERHKLEDVELIDVPLIELQLRLHKEENQRSWNLQKLGTYFSIDAGTTPDDARGVGYGRVTRIVEPGILVEVQILGVQADPSKIWQTLRPIDNLAGPRVQTSQDLVPGDYYLLKTGAQSMVDDLSKAAVREIRMQYDNWVHVYDAELDAPDLPPPDFKRR